MLRLLLRLTMPCVDSVFRAKWLGRPRRLTRRLRHPKMQPTRWMRQRGRADKSATRLHGRGRRRNGERELERETEVSQERKRKRKRARARERERAIEREVERLWREQCSAFVISRACHHAAAWKRRSQLLQSRPVAMWFAWHAPEPAAARDSFHETRKRWSLMLRAHGPPSPPPQIPLQLEVANRWWPATASSHLGQLVGLELLNECPQSKTAP